MIRMLTAGESHGKSLVGIIEGFPSGVKIDVEYIDKELKRRQMGYGRGKRMKIENDKIEVISGIRGGKTIGSPIAFVIKNLDYEKWKNIMSPYKSGGKKVEVPRPGHADFSGMIKYKLKDIRNVLERASARETAVRVAAGGFFKLFLSNFGIRIFSHTLSIGNIISKENEISFEDIEDSPLNCVDSEAEKEMISLIDEVGRRGDSVGGISEVIIENIPVGLGSYVSFDRRLDSKIGSVMLSIPSVKGVEIGPAFENTRLSGADVHDEIFYSREKGYFRRTNRAGGIEGGISNGEKIKIRLAVKPIPTLIKPLKSVNIHTKMAVDAHVERADTCVVPAVGVIGEAMAAYVVSDMFCEKFGGDNLSEIKKTYRTYIRRINNE